MIVVRKIKKEDSVMSNTYGPIHEIRDKVVWAEGDITKTPFGPPFCPDYGNGPFEVVAVYPNNQPTMCACDIDTLSPEHVPNEECGMLPNQWCTIKQPNGTVIKDSFDSSWFKKA